MATILYGKPAAEAVLTDVKHEVEEVTRIRGVTPTLAVVLIGRDVGSTIYVDRKRSAAADTGIATRDHLFPDGLTEDRALTLVRELNADPGVHGILVQLPLPKGMNEGRVLEAISPEKDVDGFHPENLGRLMLGTPTMVPCTPAGIMAILDHYEIPLAGKRAVVIGRSRIVGKPVAQLLLARDCTVTMAHSKTRDLPGVARQADVLVVATGRARLVGADYVKEGATVIDVGINRLPTGKVVGDVDFDAVASRASAITPVPGGVGLMTVAMLMRNTVRACRQQTGA